MTAKRWSYSAGERGFSRVRAYEEERGGILVEFYERDPTRQGTRRVRFSLGHRHRKRARQKVNQIVAALERGEAVAADDANLRQLFDIYEGEVTPTKAPDSRRHDRLCIAMFTRCFGASRRVSTLNRRDWDNFIRLRREGDIGPRGRPVRNRQIEYDLKFLRAVFNWAMAARHKGRILLAQNPFHGKAYRLPTEKNPNRRVMTEPQYQALRKIAATMDWRFALALDLANETGHRRNAIRLLRWSDVDPNARTVRWRADNEKTGVEHTTPLTAAAVRALVEARKHEPRIGNEWVLPSPRWPDKPVSRSALDRWLAGAQAKAGLSPLGWHSLRRKFANELHGAPLKDLCTLGGWKDPKTILQCYQVPDQDRMRHALAARKPLGTPAPNRQSNRQSWGE